MRRVIGGNGSDTTVATQEYLNSTDKPLMRDLIIIGPPENPNALYLTNHEAPVLYRPYGLFHPAVVKRPGVETKAGLDAQALAISWSPGASAQASQTASNATASSPFVCRRNQPMRWPRSSS